MNYRSVLLLLAAWLCATPAPAQTALPQVDLGAYFKRDAYERIKISPTGEYLAVTVPQ